MLRVNADRIGVVLQEGTHRIVLTHRARGFAAGLVIAALTTLGLGPGVLGPSGARFDPKEARVLASFVSDEPSVMSRATPGLSIFFPAYNDAGTIASLAIVAHMTARTLTDDYEVIVIDDGSPDHTGALLDEMARASRGSRWSITRRTAATAGRCGPASRRPRRSSSSTPTATRSTTRASFRRCGRPSRPRWTSSTATRSRATTRCTAS